MLSYDVNNIMCDVSNSFFFFKLCNIKHQSSTCSFSLLCDQRTRISQISVNCHFFVPLPKTLTPLHSPFCLCGFEIVSNQWADCPMNQLFVFLKFEREKCISETVTSPFEWKQIMVAVSKCTQHKNVELCSFSAEKRGKIGSEICVYDYICVFPQKKVQR